jgi:hypothetical protein
MTACSTSPAFKQPVLKLRTSRSAGNRTSRGGRQGALRSGGLTISVCRLRCRGDDVSAACTWVVPVLTLHTPVQCTHMQAHNARVTRRKQVCPSTTNKRANEHANYMQTIPDSWLIRQTSNNDHKQSDMRLRCHNSPQSPQAALLRMPALTMLVARQRVPP